MKTLFNSILFVLLFLNSASAQLVPIPGGPYPEDTNPLTHPHLFTVASASYNLETNQWKDINHNLDGTRFLLDQPSAIATTKKNTYYTNAVVKITADTWAGSGTIHRKVYSASQKAWFAYGTTNQHVTIDSKRILVVWPKLNYRTTGTILSSSYPNDVSLFIVKLPANRVETFPVLKILCAHTKLPRGTEMEIIGYGKEHIDGQGWMPKNFHRRGLKLRGFSINQRTQTGPKKDILLNKPYAYSGDSGGAIVAIIKGKPYFAGVLWGHNYAHAEGLGYAHLQKYILTKGIFNNIKVTRFFNGSFRDRLRERRGNRKIFGKDNGCDGFHCQQQYEDQDYSDEYISNVPDDLVDEKDVDTKAPDPDEDKDKDDGNNDSLEERIVKRLTIIIKKEIAEHKHDREPFPEIEEVVHFVAVAPSSHKFSPSLDSVRTKYSGIKRAPLPSFPIGRIPQLVEYKNSIPIRIYKGSQEVNSVLYRVQQGQYPK